MVHFLIPLTEEVSTQGGENLKTKHSSVAQLVEQLAVDAI